MKLQPSRMNYVPLYAVIMYENVKRMETQLENDVVSYFTTNSFVIASEYSLHRSLKGLMTWFIATRYIRAKMRTSVFLGAQKCNFKKLMKVAQVSWTQVSRENGLYRLHTVTLKHETDPFSFKVLPAKSSSNVQQAYLQTESPEQ